MLVAERSVTGCPTAATPEVVYSLAAPTSHETTRPISIMNDNTTTHSRRYFLDLAFKIIGAIGVLAAIYFGYHTIIDNDEPIQEIYAKAELLSKRWTIPDHLIFVFFNLNSMPPSPGMPSMTSHLQQLGNHHYTQHTPKTPIWSIRRAAQLLAIRYSQL